MFRQNAHRLAPDLAGRPKSRAHAGTVSSSPNRSYRKERSVFLKAYSPISFSQALRVILLLMVCLGFSRISHVALASPGALVGGALDHGFVGQFRNIR